MSTPNDVLAVLGFFSRQRVPRGHSHEQGTTNAPGHAGGISPLPPSEVRPFPEAQPAAVASRREPDKHWKMHFSARPLISSAGRSAVMPLGSAPTMANPLAQPGRLW